MTTLTSKEQNMLKVFFNTSVEDCGQCTADFNESMMSASDIQDALGWGKQSIGGVMASLLEKGLIRDTGESFRDDKTNDFILTYKGIQAIA